MVCNELPMEVFGKPEPQKKKKQIKQKPKESKEQISDVDQNEECCDLEVGVQLKNDIDRDVRLRDDSHLEVQPRDDTEDKEIETEQQQAEEVDV